MNSIGLTTLTIQDLTPGNIYVCSWDDYIIIFKFIGYQPYVDKDRIICQYCNPKNAADWNITKTPTLFIPGRHLRYVTEAEYKYYEYFFLKESNRITFEDFLAEDFLALTPNSFDSYQITF